jgi:hypothetical protein
VLVKHIAAEIAAKGAKEAAKKKNDDATAMLVGCCVGAAAHAAASGTESADTRYWALLPDRIEGALAVVPAGKHQVSIRTAVGTKPLGEITVPAGRLVIVPARTFPDPVPSPYPAGK